MADIKALAIRAAEIKRTKNALTVAEAIGKAIRGQGITYAPDVKRLMSKVGSELARNEHDAKRTARRRA